MLGFTQRGTHTTLTVHPDRLLDSNYSLNTADICPVGALTSNDFRFQMRVWFLKETPTIDVNCGTGTNITVWTRGNTIHRITPRQNNEVNSCWMPDSHRLNFHYIDSEARFTEPLAKDGAQHRPLGWPEALATAAAQLKAHRAGTNRHHRLRPHDQRGTLPHPHARRRHSARRTSRWSRASPRRTPCSSPPTATRTPPARNSSSQTEDPFAKLDTIREGVRSGAIKALLVLGEDLITDAGFHFEDLAKLDFLLQSHILANPTALAAHLVLPAAAFAEKRGSMVNLSGRLQRLNRAVEPPGQARDDWEILRDLTAAIPGGNQRPPHHIEDVFKALAATVPAFNGLTLAKIGQHGTPVVDTGYQIPLLAKERARKAAVG